MYKEIFHDIFNVLNLPYTIKLAKNAVITRLNKLTNKPYVTKIPLIATISINK